MLLSIAVLAATPKSLLLLNRVFDQKALNSDMLQAEYTRLQTCPAP